MNTIYQNTPEIICSREDIVNGNDIQRGDFVAGVSVSHSSSAATVCLDVRSNRGNVILTFQLSELVAAISHATLHAERKEGA